MAMAEYNGFQFFLLKWYLFFPGLLTKNFIWSSSLDMITNNIMSGSVFVIVPEVSDHIGF